MRLVTRPLLALVLIVSTSTAEAAEVPTIIVENGSGLTPWAILISGLLGAVTAVVAIAKQRITAHKEAAVNFLTRLMTDRDFKDDEQLFAELSTAGNLKKVISAASAAELKDKRAVLNYLNVFELMSLAIHRNVFDENVCKSVIGDSLVKRWGNAYDLISAIRNQTSPPDDEFYEHFETLAKEWQDNPQIIEAPITRRIWQEITRD